MKTFYRMVTLGRLTLPFVLAINCFSTTYAQDATASRMHEVGLRIANFNLENFGVIYKVQRANKPNQYTRYGFTLANISYNEQNVLESKRFNISASTNIGTERRNDLNERVQFIHGPNWGVSFNYDNSDAQGDLDGRVNTAVAVGFGYILGIQYNINERFYLSLETIPSLSVYYNWNTIEVFQGKETNNNFGASVGFNSNAAVLTFACRFARTR